MSIFILFSAKYGVKIISTKEFCFTQLTPIGGILHNEPPLQVDIYLNICIVVKSDLGCIYISSLEICSWADT